MLGAIQKFAERFIEKKGENNYNPLTPDFAPTTRQAVDILSSAPLHPNLAELVNIAGAAGRFEANVAQARLGNQFLRQIGNSATGLMQAQQQRAQMSGKIVRKVAEFSAGMETEAAHTREYVASWSDQVAAEANSLG